MTNILEKIILEKKETLAETKKKFPEWYRTQTIILGKPLTLSRVLNALESEKYTSPLLQVGYLWGSLIEPLERGDGFTDLCEWDLKKETLEGQSEETQRKINKLFN